MLINHKISILADTVVDDIKIASFSASLNADTGDMTLSSRHIDKEACKINRDIVREDQKKFEDFAYSLQDHVKEVNK